MPSICYFTWFHINTQRVNNHQIHLKENKSPERNRVDPLHYLCWTSQSWMYLNVWITWRLIKWILSYVLIRHLALFNAGAMLDHFLSIWKTHGRPWSLLMRSTLITILTRSTWLPHTRPTPPHPPSQSDSLPGAKVQLAVWRYLKTLSGTWLLVWRSSRLSSGTLRALSDLIQHWLEINTERERERERESESESERETHLPSLP